jgi:predicted nicotinamide N-methyase
VPDDFYQEIDKKHKHEEYHSPSLSRDISLEVVGHHALWGHFVWNSSMLLAQQIECGNVPLCHFSPSVDPSSVDVAQTFKGLRVLELGSGSALPSLLALVFIAFALVYH